MQIVLKANVEPIRKQLELLMDAQLREVTVKALNDAAFAARSAVQSSIASTFDRPTPYIRRSPRVKMATVNTPVAMVDLSYQGGKGVEPSKVLRAQIEGGRRGDKRAERALQRVGILQRGYSMVPGEQCPLDQFGNIKGSLIVQLLSYFRAFGEQGYRANMTDKRRQKLADKVRSERGYLFTRGVEYFVAWGRLRGGRSSHLHYGIWSRSGTHGVVVKPIIMFVRQPNYKKRLDFHGQPVEAARRAFDKRFRYHVRSVAERLASM